MSSLNSAVMMLDMSLMAAKAVVAEGKAPLQRRLAWLGAELERLAGEAYRLADEAGDDPEACPESYLDSEGNYQPLRYESVTSGRRDPRGETDPD